jgi:hypothetical protein
MSQTSQTDVCTREYELPHPVADVSKELLKK